MKRRILAAVVAALATAPSAMAQTVPTPLEHFGFETLQKRRNHQGDQQICGGTET